MDSKDLAATIMFAVLGFAFLILIAQIPYLITGVPGVGYVFNIFYNIIYSFSLLYYKGKRWLFLLQGIIFQLLTLVVPGSYAPTILVAKIPFLINVFILDVVFNSLYSFFRKNNNLVWWSILGQVYFWTAQPFLILLFFSLFVFIEGISTAWFIPIMSIMLPIMIIEAIIGGYIGFRIYHRYEKAQREKGKLANKTSAQVND
ncbi:MAG: hypothetical protein AC479_07935 [miscellaneous Crenarchaeota group-6 archaeon AD8-1]|nr:MAG: hypothetical protein AC479_07935 [miscellaneous Crenarchaeota group-6 archaeon AD8-1]